MRLLRVIPVVVLLLLSATLLIPGSDAAQGHLSLYEVNPYGEDEGVSIHNYGSSTINLSGYVIADNISKGGSEGTITFSQDLLVHPGETITLCKNEVSGSSFQNSHPTYYNKTDGVSFSSSFALNNSGDDLYLFKGSNVIDAFCYGNVTISDKNLWIGEPFKISNKWFALRTSDGKDASCWHNTKPGMTGHYFDPDIKIQATVTPFIFPDDKAVPIYRALESAKETVYIAIYILSSPNIVALLCQLEKRGVDVTVMLEMQPLGDYKPVQDASMLKTLVDAGGEVLFIGDDNDRFVYHHAKYCVIDEKKVIVTSENWSKANMNDGTLQHSATATGNRGWGAVVESPEYGKFMANVFRNDSNPSYGDVFDFNDVFVDVKPRQLTYTSPSSEYRFDSYQAQITPLLSPDSSLDATTYYINEAKTRVYSQQQNVSGDFIDRSRSSPLSAMADRAKIGVDTRLIIGNPSSASDVDTINAMFGIRAAEMTTPYVHNKGLICDDIAIVSSVNWTDNAFNNNREVMVAIHSKQVADHYAKTFEYDFNKNYRYSGLKVWFEEIESNYPSTNAITVAVGVEQSGSFTYDWILDSETKTTGNPRTMLNVSEGTHVLRVVVSDAQGSTGYVETYFTVEGTSPGMDLGFLEEYKQYIIPAIVLIIAILIAAIKAHRGGR